VLCCGVIGSKLLSERVNPWCDKYNIYILQPLFSSWSDVEQVSYEEILSRYYFLLTKDIQTEIFCMMGFSFGGELAYRLAAWWSELTGQLPLVLMGDTYFEKSTSDEQNYKYANHYEEYCDKVQGEFFKHLGTHHYPTYDGDVILVSATNNPWSSDANELKWKALKGDIRIERIDGTHQGLYENESHFPTYLTLIERF